MGRRTPQFHIRGRPKNTPSCGHKARVRRESVRWPLSINIRRVSNQRVTFSFIFYVSSVFPYFRFLPFSAVCPIVAPIPLQLQRQAIKEWAPGIPKPLHVIEHTPKERLTTENAIFALCIIYNVSALEEDKQSNFQNVTMEVIK